MDLPRTPMLLQVRPDELEAIVAEIDADGSGQVEFDEFLQVS